MAQPADRCGILLRISSSQVAETDFLESSAGKRHSSLRVLVGDVVGLSAELAAASTPDALASLQSRKVIALLSTLPASSSSHCTKLEECLPGNTIVVPLAHIILPPPTLSPEGVAAAIAVALRTYLALLFKANLAAATESAGGCNVLVLHSADAAAWSGYSLARRMLSASRGKSSMLPAAEAEALASRGAIRFFLHTSSSREYSEVLGRVEKDDSSSSADDYESVSVTVLPPHETLMSAVMRATGHCGADVILDLADRRLHSSLSHGAADGDGRRKGEEDVAATLVGCLAHEGQLLTCSAAFEIDGPLAELCRLKGLSIHYVSEASWVDAGPSSRRFGTFLAVIQRLVDDLAEGKLSIPSSAVASVEYPRSAPSSAAAGAELSSVQTDAIRKASRLKRAAQLGSEGEEASKGLYSVVMLV